MSLLDAPLELDPADLAAFIEHAPDSLIAEAARAWLHGFELARTLGYGERVARKVAARFWDAQADAPYLVNVEQWTVLQRAVEAA